MVSFTRSIVFQGIDVLEVNIQVHISPGLPSINIVGLADKAINESKDRIKSAFNSIGLSLPAKRLVINLSPADVYKDGTHFDFSIACAILVAMGLIDQDQIEAYIIIGEIALDGGILASGGVLPATYKAFNSNYGIICSQEAGAEASWIEGVNILAVNNLLDLINHFHGVSVRPYVTRDMFDDDSGRNAEDISEILDLSDIKGQESAKRALEIAAAGGHNILMIGPPGSGKSMLARRVQTILPDLNAEEVLEINMLRSIFGFIKGGNILKTPPFRSPHHTSSASSIVGGGNKAQIGEISLAHQGVLFLDELPEFQKGVIDSLREPLESKEIVISRVRYKVKYPANFQLIAAMNPCRCGNFENDKLSCSQKPECAMKYQSRISGPILDRIDLHISVPLVKVSDLRYYEKNKDKVESSANVKQRVIAARNKQKKRYSQHGFNLNAQVEGKDVEKILNVDQAGIEILYSVMDRLKLSMRAYTRVLRTARTIADLADKDNVSDDEIIEALSYRNITV